MRSPRRRLKGRSRRSGGSGKGRSDQQSSKGLFGIGKSNGAGHTPIDGFPAPEALEITPRAVKAGDTWFRTLAIVGSPREVSACWLQPLLSWRAVVAISREVAPAAHDTATLLPPETSSRPSSLIPTTSHSDRIDDVSCHH